MTVALRISLLICSAEDSLQKAFVAMRIDVLIAVKFRHRNIVPAELTKQYWLTIVRWKKVKRLAEEIVEIFFSINKKTSAKKSRSFLVAFTKFYK
jgi:hypothetical protein